MLIKDFDMPRHIRRRIRGRFHCRCFKPCGIPQKKLETLVLTHDELESIRLADINKMYQADAANMMEVSRATFARILTSAREKIALAIIEGKNLEIKEEL
jgi:predicted DNA-binding protein (UPF0251 family)